MNKFEFQIQNNEVVFKAVGGYTEFAMVAKKDGKEVSGEHVVSGMPSATVSVSISSFPWKETPKPGEEYEILVCAQNPDTKHFTEWSSQKWTAPGKATLMPRIKNPLAPVTTQPPAPVRAPAATASPAAIPDHQLVDEINERINIIESDLDFTITKVRDTKDPDLSGVYEMIGQMRGGMRNISTIIASIEKSCPDECSNFKIRMDQILEKMKQLQDMCRAIMGLKLANRKNVSPRPTAPAGPSVNPAPVVPVVPAVDLAPVNDRIDDLEQQLRGVTSQLADKASADDLHNLSGRVDGLTGQVTSLDTKVGGLDKTCTDGFTSLQGAIVGITTQITNAAASTPAATSATPPAANATPVVATAPVVPAATAAPATPANVMPATTPATTNGGKNKKKSRESVNFFVLVLGIVLGVLALIAMFFYATRSQNITEQRIGASDSKSAAAAEIENARRLQVEMMDRMHDLQQQVEGYRRQTFVTPPMPAESPTTLQVVTNKIVTTNVVVMTNTVVTHTTSQDESGPRRPAIEMGPVVYGSWSPTPMQNRYDYRRQGFNGYIYPY